MCKLKPLNQNDFQMKIIEDLGTIYTTVTSKKKCRFAIFECTKCSKHFKSNVVRVRSNKMIFCIKCVYSNKKLKPLNQDDFKMKI